jgi:stage V sporulation protein D (sporulation-specific penicillin-binding protein)
VAASTNRNSANLRLYLLGSILVLWSVGICIRLVYLQVFRYGSFEQKAQHQQQRTEEVSAIRGAIYDRQGRALAMTVSVDSAFVAFLGFQDFQS